MAFVPCIIPQIGDKVMFYDSETNKGYEDEYEVFGLKLDDDEDLIVTLEKENGEQFDCYACELVVKV